MSTTYRAMKPIPFERVFDGRLEKYGIKEIIKDDTSKDQRYLTGCDGILEVCSEQDGADTLFVRPSFCPMPWAVCDALAEEFGTEFVHDGDHRFWGFNTKEDWDAYQDEIHREQQDEFYNDMLRFVRGESHNLTPGTIGFGQAEIAKTLIEGDSTLAEPENREELFEAIEKSNEREHPPLRGTLTEEDVAMAELMMARRSDLAKG